MTWFEGEVGTVQNVQCEQSSGELRTFPSGSVVTLEVKPRGKPDATATSLTATVVTDGLISYTRAASDLTLGEYDVRVKHVDGSNVGYSRIVALDVVRP